MTTLKSKLQVNKYSTKVSIGRDSKIKQTSHSMCYIYELIICMDVYV